MKRLILLALLAFTATAQAQNVFRPITSYQVNITATEITAPQTLRTNTRVARVLCSVSCAVAFPVSPVATVLTVPVTLNANVYEYFKVSPGSVINVRSLSGSGKIYITEME